MPIVCADWKTAIGNGRWKYFSIEGLGLELQIMSEFVSSRAIFVYIIMPDIL